MTLDFRPDTAATSGSLKIYTRAGERLRTAESVAELAGCKVGTLDSIVSRGQVPAPLGRVGHTRLWSSTVLDAWFASKGNDQVSAEAGGQVAAKVGDKVAAEVGDVVPAELRALRRWTRQVHRRPIMTNGDPAWVMDPTTWTTYSKAKASDAGDGLDFVLDGDGIVAIDLTHCVVDGVLTPGAQAILDLLPDTYAEFSLSGHGVRLFCHASATESRRFSSHGISAQVSGSGRFLTVTGNRLPGRPSVLADHHAMVSALLLGDA